MAPPYSRLMARLGRRTSDTATPTNVTPAPTTPSAATEPGPSRQRTQDQPPPYSAPSSSASAQAHTRAVGRRAVDRHVDAELADLADSYATVLASVEADRLEADLALSEALGDLAAVRARLADAREAAERAAVLVASSKAAFDGERDRLERVRQRGYDEVEADLA
ncbi:uncharacterized protein LOC62_01G000075 [Vanrija pseudolonga]|uniref:Uncharacterized protein n=1 Tax=Vanrija pseudolonga TaxID=143232 RepID=A0AAF1BHX9_9TREE|nr:hypothetical protein LOC62_01G000075 [Vanrija pseudolonga]